MYFRNLVSAPKPQSPLFQQEIDVIVSVVQNFLTRMEPNATLGTVILDGQKFGESAGCILRFDLPDGPFTASTQSGVMDSRQIAEQAIDEILFNPCASRYCQGLAPERQAIRERFRCQYGVYTNIWQDDELMVLVLNATHGRFLISCSLRGNSIDLPPNYGEQISIALLYGIAQTIVKIGPEDRTLQDTGRPYLHQAIIRRDDIVGALSASVEFLIEDLFHRCDTPELSAWKAWRQSAQCHLAPFFV